MYFDNKRLPCDLKWRRLFQDHSVWMSSWFRTSHAHHLTPDAIKFKKASPKFCIYTNKRILSFWINEIYNEVVNFADIKPLIESKFKSTGDKKTLNINHRWLNPLIGNYYKKKLRLIIKKKLLLIFVYESRRNIYTVASKNTIVKCPGFPIILLNEL